MTTHRYVAYHRVSTASQGRSGLGLEAQQASVDAFVRANGGRVVNTFVEVESGLKCDRARLNEAFAACRIYKATLLVAKMDRLSRDAAFLLGLQKSNIDFQCVDNPHADRLTVGFLAVVSENEAKNISARTKAALAAARARGVVLGKPENLTDDGRKRGNKRSAEARSQTSQAFAEDLRPHIEKINRSGVRSYAMLAVKLNELGITTARGCKWTPVAVERVLKRLKLLYEVSPAE